MPRRPPRDRLSTATAVLVGAMLVLAGCTLPPGQADRTTTLPSSEEAVSRYDRIDGINATVNTTLRREGNVSWSVQRIATRPGTGEFRNVVLSTGPPSNRDSPFQPGSRVVSNGSVRYIYAAESDRVFRSEVSREPRNRSAEIGRLFAELRDGDNESIRRPTPGVSSLPVVPAGSQSSGATDESVRWRDDNVTVRYRGTATVNGWTTYVVELRPATDESSLVEATLWLDTEYLHPVKRHTVFERRGDRYEYTTTYRNLTVNPGLPPGTFRFDPESLPDDVSVVESGSYDSREAMVSDLDWPVPDPDVPDGFEFESGFHSSGDRRHLSLTYADGNGRSIRVSVFGEPANLSTGRRVTVGSRQAVIRTFRGQRYLLWNQHGRQYSVTGSVENRTLRRIAASVVEDGG